MRNSLGLVVLLAALASSSVFGQSAGQIQIWVNGATPAPRLRVVDQPGRVLPAVRNCAPQYNGGGNANDWAAAAFLLQALAASQQQGNCQQGFGYVPSYGYGQNFGYGGGYNADDLALYQNARERAILAAQAEVLSAQQDLNEAIAAPLSSSCRTQLDIELAQNRRSSRILSAQSALIRAQQELRRIQSGF